MSVNAPGLPPAPEPTAGPHPAPPLERPELPAGVEPTPVRGPWRAWTAWAALVAGFGAAIVGALVIGITSLGFGASLEDPPPSVNILATVIQNACLIGAAVLFARMTGQARPEDFGLRPARVWPAIGWTLLTWVTFILVTAAWVTLLGVDDTQEDLPEELGVDESTIALLAVAFLVCVVAPIGEEFFFRGYFFTALRSWKGLWPAALITGLVFGAIHAGSSDPAFLVPLGFFGFALCLLYVRTGSLYPCIAAHAVNNSIAFGASQDWGWEILPLLAGALAVIAALLAAVRAIAGPAVARAPAAA
jgi:membrane protease YdiL (CAAX protease family)